MIIGIDASNLRRGGGITHLFELLRAASPESHGFSKVIVWGGRQMLTLLEDRPWLVKSWQPLLDRNLTCRVFWQQFRLARLMRETGCDVLFVPGGLALGSCQPVVTMCRNLLPFEWRELRRYGVSWLSLKCLILRLLQGRTFRGSTAVIFLTRYARDVVTTITGTIERSTIIPHGIDARFACSPREQLEISAYCTNRPFKVLYVSIVDMYKHQWHVVDAVCKLRKSGMPISLSLVGPAYPPALKLLRRMMSRVDPQGLFVRYVGAVPYRDLRFQYSEAQLCVFASSCENMPNILLEGMASGLPIACSNRGPMSEVLGNAGVYFDPEDPEDIARAIDQLVKAPLRRSQLAQAAFDRAQSYSWERCAQETFELLAAVTVTQKPVTALQ